MREFSIFPEISLIITVRGREREIRIFIEIQ